MGVVIGKQCEADVVVGKQCESVKRGWMGVEQPDKRAVVHFRGCLAVNPGKNGFLQSRF